MSTSQPRLVVGLGASAGGLDALERFFDAVPDDTGMAFVVVQHLAPNYQSLLDQLLARHTTMPVAPVVDGVAVEPDHVYILPPARDITIIGGRLRLTEKVTPIRLDLPIDRFFQSLANDLGSRGVAIVLSGTGSDGSRGLVAVHEAGGLVVAQTLESSAFDGMPRSAQDTGHVDVVMSPEGIPEVLVRYADHPRSAESASKAAKVLTATEGSMKSMFRLLRNAYGIDFASYKTATIQRRIERRMLLEDQSDLSAYAERLERDPIELNRLYEDLLIGVTEFFRDREAYEYLEGAVIPELVAAAEDGGEIRVWTAATATGEEAYSLAVLLAEAIEECGRNITARIFATDVHEESLQTAMLGLYEESRLENTTDERRDRYFVRKPGGYQVHPDIRRMVVFAKHDVVRDPPFTGMDLITCRNLLIYFNPDVQQRVIGLLHFGLRMDGTLWLGSSETLGAAEDSFETLNEHWRVFRKTRGGRLFGTPEPAADRTERIASRRSVAVTPGSNRMLETYDKLLERFMPPALLIGEDRRLLHVFGGAGRFLRPRDGRPTDDAFDAMVPELRATLAAAVDRVLNERTPVVLHGIIAGDDPDAERFVVTVDPVLNRHARRHDLLIRFEPKTKDELESTPPAELDVDEATRARLTRLETELRFARENLQATVQDHEATNQELQATNEELVAANEQMQSTNEELQSLNEELYTVNAEHQRKIAELVEMTNDMENFLNSTDVDTIFLDKNLRIRRFTPGIAETFNLIPQDVGRPIGNFTFNLDCPTLLDDVAAVIEEERFRELQVRDGRGRRFLLRLFPYVAMGEVDGVVLALINVESLKQVEDELRDLSSIVEHSRDAIFRIDFDGRIRTWNLGAASLFDVDADEVLQCSVDSIVPAENRVALRSVLSELRGGAESIEDLEIRLEIDGRPRIVSLTFSMIRGASGEPGGFAVIGRNVTEQRRAEEDVRDSVVRRDHFLSMLSHELRNPLNAISTAAHLLDRLAGDNDDSSRVRPAVSVIGGQTRHMARLLDDLLDVARITQDRLEMKMSRFDLRDTARGALEEVQGHAEVKGVELTTSIPESPVQLVGDSARLQQVQANLLANAIKFTNPGGRIDFSVEATSDSAVIVISDDGIGIDPKFLTDVFELFVQAESGRRTGNEAGMGVGLALVKRIVEKHEGCVSIHSAGLGQGCTVRVELPTAMPGESFSEPAAALAEKGTAADERGPGTTTSRRIVVVEDNADSREMLCELLGFGGHDTSSAGTGEEGLELIVKNRPDIAFVDIDLPGMSGYEVAEKLAKRTDLNGLRLVALTGFGRDEDRERALAAGFDHHLVKPFSTTEIDAVLDA